MKNCRLNPIYRANCNSLVLNWLQEQSTCHIGVITSLIDSYSFIFDLIAQLLNKYTAHCVILTTPPPHHQPPL